MGLALAMALLLLVMNLQAAHVCPVRPSPGPREGSSMVAAGGGPCLTCLMAQPAASDGAAAPVSPLQREETSLGVPQPRSIASLDIFDFFVRPPPAL